MTRSAPRAPRGLVLIVDDEPDIRAFLEMALTDEGYAVLHAANGEEALDALRAHRPDVILLDLFMPVMDGRTFVAAYRHRPGPHAPIVTISASAKVLGGAGKPHGGVEDDTGVRRTRADASGTLPEVEANLDKPFELDALFGTIRNVVSRAGGAPAEN